MLEAQSLEPRRRRWPYEPHDQSATAQLDVVSPQPLDLERQDAVGEQGQDREVARCPAMRAVLEFLRMWPDAGDAQHDGMPQAAGNIACCRMSAAAPWIQIAMSARHAAAVAATLRTAHFCSTKSFFEVFIHEPELQPGLGNLRLEPAELALVSGLARVPCATVDVRSWDAAFPQANVRRGRCAVTKPGVHR